MSSRFGLAVAALLVNGTSCSDGDNKLTFEMSAKAGNWTKDHAATGSEEVELSFWVKETHLHKLKNVLDSVSDPSSSNYGNYLTKEQVDELTAPTEHDVAVVDAALRPYEIQHKGGSSIIVSTVPVSFAAQLFGGEFVHYCRGDGKQRECALRNPTAHVPAALHEACDIITPLYDPLPPLFHGPIVHGPIVSPPSGATDVMAAAAEGCCYSYGFGAFMKPCCLETTRVSDEAACKTEQRLGGTTKFKVGACPTSAEEAATSGAALAKTSTFVGAASSLEAEPQQGCCISIGFGALMRPCCLSTKKVADEGACAVAGRIGGRTFYHSGECPTSAEEASKMAPLEQPMEEAEVLSAPAPAESHEEGSPVMFTISSAGVAALLIGSVVMWLRGRQEARNAPLLEAVPE